MLDVPFLSFNSTFLAHRDVFCQDYIYWIPKYYIDVTIKIDAAVVLILGKDVQVHPVCETATYGIDMAKGEISETNLRHVLCVTLIHLSVSSGLQ